jgi:hypothetical protein
MQATEMNDPAGVWQQQIDPTPGEINAVVTELKELYADEGSKLRTAKLAAGPLIRQPGELKRHTSADTSQ